jgi:hypothetical protein
MHEPNSPSQIHGLIQRACEVCQLHLWVMRSREVINSHDGPYRNDNHLI